MTKRRLPVLQPKDDGEEQERPAWQWPIIGAFAVVIAFLPLSMLANAYRQHVLARWLPSDPEAAADAARKLESGTRLWLGAITVLGPLVALALAGMLSGLLVGRFGAGAGKREAAMGGVGAGLFISLLALADSLVSRPAPAAADSGWLFVWLWTAVIMTVLSGVAAYGGAILGARLRR